MALKSDTSLNKCTLTSKEHQYSSQNQQGDFSRTPEQREKMQPSKKKKLFTKELLALRSQPLCREVQVSTRIEPRAVGCGKHKPFKFQHPFAKKTPELFESQRLLFHIFNICRWSPAVSGQSAQSPLSDRLLSVHLLCNFFCKVFFFLFYAFAYFETYNLTKCEFLVN